MMVTGLQLPFQSSPLDGRLAKSQSLDSAAIQSLSFGEILKAKEKQLQQEQEVSASSIAAALANLQTLSIAMPSVPEIETSDSVAKVDTQSAAQTNANNLKSQQIDLPTPLGDGLPQFAANKALTIDLPATPQTATGRSVPTELPVSISDPSQIIQAESPETASVQSIPVEDRQVSATSFSKPETTICKTTLNRVMSTVEKTAVKTESTLLNLKITSSDILSNTVTTQLENPVVGTKIVEAQVKTAESPIEIPNSMIALDAQSETENIAAQFKFQTSADVKVSPQSLLSNSLPLQAEAKDVRLQSDAISQTSDVSKIPANEAAVTKMNAEDAADKFVLPSVPQAEISEETLVQSSPVQIKMDQETTPLVPEQTEKPANTPAPTVEMSSETPVPALADQSVQDQVPSLISAEQTEASNPTSVQLAVVQAKVSKETNSFSSQEVEKPVNAPEPTMQSTDAAPIHQPTAQAVTDNELIAFTSGQVEKPINTNASTVEVPDKTPIPYLSIRSETGKETIPFTSELVENLANPTISQIEISNPNSVQRSIAQAEAEQKTTPLASEQVEQLVNRPTFQAFRTTPIQYSVDQLAIDGGTVTPVPQQETVSSSIAVLETKEATLDSEIPVSPLVSSYKETDIKTEKGVTQTVKHEETPAINPVQLTSDPQAEIATEAKAVAAQTDKAKSTGFTSKFATEANESVETEPALQLQQGEVTNSKANANIDHETEKAIPPVSVQTRTVTTASVQSEIKLPLVQAEIDDASLVETRVPEAKTATTAQPTVTRQFIDGVIRNTEAYQVKTSEQALPDEPPVSVSDKSTYQETNKVLKQPVLIAEVIDDSSADVLSETPLSYIVDASEDAVEIQQVEIPDYSTPTSVTNILVNEEENVDYTAEKLVTPPAVQSETTAANTAQTTPQVDLDLAKTNQEAIDGQAVADEVPLPTQNGEVETNSLPANNTHSSNETEETVSHTKAANSQSVQDLPETQPASNVKISGEVVDNVKQVEQLKDEAGIPASKSSMVEDESVDKGTVLESSVTSSTANTTSFAHATETFVTLSSTLSDLPNIDSVEPTPDIHSDSVVGSRKTMTQTSVADPTADVVGPGIDPSSTSKELPVVETSSYLKDIVPSEPALVFGASVGEDLGLQHDEPLPVRQSLPQTDSIGFNVGTENEAEIAGEQPNASYAEETTARNQPTIDVVETPISAKYEEIATESKMVKPQASVNTPLTGIPQAKIETYDIAKDLPTRETSDYLKIAIPGETASISDANVGKDVNLRYDQPLQAEQSFRQNGKIDFNIRSRNDVEITGTQATVSYVKETTTTANQLTIDGIDAPINTEYQEVSIESKMVKPQADTTIPSTQITQPRIEFSPTEKNTVITATNNDSTKIEMPTGVPVEKTVIDLNPSETNRVDTSIHAEPEELALESKIIRPKISTDTPYVRISQSAVKFSTIEKDTVTANAHADPVEVKTQTFVKAEEPVINLDQPVIDAMKTHVDMQQPIAESKTVKPQAGIDTPSIEIPQSETETSGISKDLPIMQAGNETSEVETQTTIHSEKIAIPLNEAKPSITQTEIGIGQDKTVFEQKTVLTQEQVETSSAEVQQPATVKTFVTETNTGSEVKEALYQAVMHQDVSQEELLWSTNDVPMTPTTENQKELIFAPKSVEPPVNTSESVENLQSNFTAPSQTVVSNQTHMQSAPLTAQSVTQSEIPNTSASETQSVKPTSEAVETKNVEKQVSIDATEAEVSQSAMKPVEKAEVRTEAGGRKGSEEPVFVRTNENFNDSRTTFMNESKTAATQVPLSSTSYDEIPASSQPGASIKVEASKQVLRTKPAASKDEQILPAEKQPRQNQTLESAASTTGPVKDSVTVGYSGKVPIDQVNAQAAEVAQQVIHQMNVKIKNALTSMHLQLNPKELGTIDVEMVSTSEGVSVTFFTEQANTGKLLETQLNQLRESLIDSGVQLSGLNISQHGPSEQKGGFFSQDTGFAQYPQRDVTQSEVNVKATPRAERITGQLGEVDYLI